MIAIIPKAYSGIYIIVCEFILRLFFILQSSNYFSVDEISNRLYDVFST